MRILSRRRSQKDEGDILKVDTKLGEDDEDEPYCLDSPTSSLSASSDEEDDSSSSSSSDDDDSDDSDDSSGEESSSDEESSDEDDDDDEDDDGDEEEEEEINPPRNVIMATESMISHRLPRKPRPSAPTQKIKSLFTPKRKVNLPSPSEDGGNDGDDDSQPSTPSSQPDNGQEAADALGRELEDMGYNLRSNSFFTRAEEKDEERDERYQLSIDDDDDVEELAESRQASSPRPIRRDALESKCSVVARATESRQDAIEALRSVVSGAVSPSKESIPLKKCETNPTLGSRTWYKFPSQTNAEVKNGNATEASPSALTNTSAKLRDDGRNIKDLDSASDIQVTLSGIADVKNSIVMTKKEAKKKQVYRPPVDVLRSPMVTKVPSSAAVPERPMEKTVKASPQKSGATQPSSPVLINEPEKEKNAKVSEPTGRKVPLRRRFIAAGESSNSTPIISETSPRPLTPRDYRPPKGLTPHVFEERLQRIRAARQELAQNGNQTTDMSKAFAHQTTGNKGAAPKRHITPPTPAGVIQGLRQAAHDQVGGMVDSPPLSPVFIEGLSFLNGNIQEAANAPQDEYNELAQHPVDFKDSAEHEDLTCSDIDEPSKGTVRRRKAWFHNYYHREDNQPEVEFVEEDDDEIEIIPTPAAPKSPVKKVLRMFSPRKNWEKKKEFSSEKVNRPIFNDDGVLREHNHKRHFARPTPREDGVEDNQEKKNSMKPWEASGGIPSKSMHDENAPTSTRSVDDALGGMREVGALFKGDESLLTMDTTFMNLGDNGPRQTTDSNVLGNNVSNGTQLMVANNNIPANDGENASRQTGDNSTLAGQTIGTRDTGTCSGTRLERIEVQIQETASDDKKKKKKGGLMNIFRKKQRTSADVAANEVKVSCEESKPPAKHNMLKNLFQKSSPEKNKEKSEQPCALEAPAQLSVSPENKAVPADVTKTEADPVASPKAASTSKAVIAKEETDRKLVVVETASSDQMFLVVDNKEDAKGKKASPRKEEAKKDTASSTKEEVQKDKASPIKGGTPMGAEEKKSLVEKAVLPNPRSRSKSPSHQRSSSGAPISTGVSRVQPKSSPVAQPQSAPLSSNKAEQHFSLVQAWNEFMNYCFDPKSQLTTPEAESGNACSAIVKDTARKAIVPGFAACGADLLPKESGFEVVRLESARGLSRFSCSAPAVKASPKRGAVSPFLCAAGGGSKTSPKMKMVKSAVFHHSSSEDENSLIATAEPLPPPVSKPARKNQPDNSFDSRRNANIISSFMRSKDRPRLTETDPDRAEKYIRRRTEFDDSTLTSLPGDVNSSESNENQHPDLHPQEVISEASDDTSEDAWTKIADAAAVVEQALKRIETIHSGDSADPDQLLRQLISVGSGDSAVVHDLENALKVLKKQAARLGVRESDLLLAVKGDDCNSVDEETSINTLTFTEEVIDAYNMIKKTPKRKRRKN